MKKFCQVWLTCADQDEASKIAEVLLKKRLVACVKHVPVGADFLWKDGIDHNDEILMIMESREDLFEEIEEEVEKLHNYDTFVLQAIPITKLSQKAQAWLNSSLK